MDRVLIFLYLSSVFGEEKRLLLHTDADLVSVINEMKQEIADLKSEVNTLKATNLPSGNSDVYIRWGRTSCPSNGTEFVYSGYMAGGYYSDDGGGANNLCLPDHPTWNKYVDGYNNGATIYGTEIELDPSVSSALFGQNVINQDIPCAVCRTRASAHMFPARTNCYSGWTMEYSGYLISSHPTWKDQSDYICLDVNLEFVAHGAANDNAHVIRPVEVKCGNSGGLPCPPYVDGRELACVVCSK
ncbi:hypothetical protein ACF0H5_005929 [Mactra antiquata]